MMTRKTSYKDGNKYKVLIRTTVQSLLRSNMSIFLKAANADDPK